MVTVFGILNLTEDSFFDESRRLDPAGAVTAAIEMLRVGSDVVDVGPAASHPDARPVSPADEIRRIAPLLDALSIDRNLNPQKIKKTSQNGCFFNTTFAHMNGTDD